MHGSLRASALLGWVAATLAGCSDQSGLNGHEIKPDLGDGGVPSTDLSVSGSGDLAGADLAGVDLAGVDLAGMDLASGPVTDSGVPHDLASAPHDLATAPQDLATAPVATSRYWNWDGAGNAVAGNGSTLYGVPRFAVGPCAGHPSSCVFDTRTFVILGGVSYESITAYGRYWNWNADDGSVIAGSGSTLDSVARFAVGPCAGRAAGTCTFDTRTFATLGGVTYESVTAYGRFWNWDASDGSVISGSGSLLESVARYAAGPCAGRAAGTCTFDTRTFLASGGVTYESVTAYGRYWNWDAADGSVIAGSGSLLETVARYAAGPCAAQAAGQCKLDSRTFAVLSGVLYESLTATH